MDKQREIDRFLQLMLALSLVAFAGVCSLGLYLNDSSYYQVWQETKALMAASSREFEQQRLSALRDSLAPRQPSPWTEYVAWKAADLSRLLSAENLRLARDSARQMYVCIRESLIIAQQNRQKMLSAEAEAIDKPHELFPIVAQIESNSDSRKVGDKGEAVGAAQIWKCVVDDVNRIEGARRFLYRDRASIDKSREIFAIYLEYYGDQYRDKTGHEPTPEVWARIWNGGPDGWQKAKTRQYWRKVSSLIGSGPDV